MIVTKKPKHKVLITYEDQKWSNISKSICKELDELYNIEAEHLFTENELIKYLSMANHEYTIISSLDIELGNLNKIECRAVCARNPIGQKSNTVNSHRLQKCFSKNIQMKAFNCSNFSSVNIDVESIKKYQDDYKWFFKTDIPIIELNCNVDEKNLFKIKEIFIDSIEQYIYRED